jgi:hypothetical protein
VWWPNEAEGGRLTDSMCAQHRRVAQNDTTRHERTLNIAGVDSFSPFFTFALFAVLGGMVAPLCTSAASGRRQEQRGRCWSCAWRTFPVSGQRQLCA